MEESVLDLGKTVHDLCTDHPGLPAILALAGFWEIVRPGMLATAGRFMTIPKGAALKGIDLEAVGRILASHGYKIKEGSV